MSSLASWLQWRRHARRESFKLRLTVSCSGYWLWKSRGTSRQSGAGIRKSLAAQLSQYRPLTLISQLQSLFGCVLQRNRHQRSFTMSLGLVALILCFSCPAWFDQEDWLGQGLAHCCVLQDSWKFNTSCLGESCREGSLAIGRVSLDSCSIAWLGYLQAWINRGLGEHLYVLE